MPETFDINKIVNDCCRRFRRAIEGAGETNVELFTATVDEFSRLTLPDRKKLLIALIQIEIEANRIQGKSSYAEDYVQRFPDFDRALFDALISLPEVPNRAAKNNSLPDKYELLDEIGVGGIGIVWRVNDKQMRRPLAIKTLKPTHRKNWLANERLRREAVLTGGLQHPGVPPVFEQGTFHDGSQFFAMKLVEGNTLAEILENQPKNTSFLIGVFEQVAQTLAYAHSNGVIHRDVKPQNIMVGEFGEVQLMDWGMAKHLGQANDSNGSGFSTDQLPSGSDDKNEGSNRLETANASIDSSLANSLGLSTKQGEAFGTPAYMSPEQAKGNVDSIDKRSDVFGLGHLLFEILTGQRLYEGDSAREALSQAAKGDYGSVEKRLSSCEVDSELKSLCCACVEVKPDDRPDDAGIVAESIAKYQANVQSRLKQAEIDRTSALIQSREQAKRTRTIVWMSGLVAVACIIGTAAFAWQSQKAMTSAKNAQFESETRSEIGQFFVFDVLGQADPNLEPNRDLKVRTVLDRAAKTIENRFQDRPKIEAEIRIQLAESYFGLGEYATAGRQFSLAHQLVQETYGEDSDRDWEIRYELAKVESALGNDQQALEMLDRIQEVFAQRHGEQSPQVLHVLADKSTVLTSLARFEEANQIAAEVAAIADAQPVDGIRANSLRIKQAVNLLELGKYKACRSILDETLADLKTKVISDGTGKITSASGMHNVFDYLNAKMTEGNLFELADGDFEQAETLYQGLLVASNDVVGEKHPTTLEVKHNLTIAMMRQGKIQAAKEILEDTIPVAEESIGTSSGLTIRLKNSLASCYSFLGKTESAIELFLSLGKILNELHTEPHHNTIANNQNLGGLNYRLKNYQESEQYLEKALADSMVLFGERHARTIVTLASIAKTHGALKKYEQAEKEFLRSLEIGEEILDPNHPDNIFTLSDLCHLYMVSKQYDKAKPQLQKLLQKREELDGPDAGTTLKTLGDLGVALYELNEFSESKPMLVRSHEYRVKKYGPVNSRTITRFLTLIKTEMELGEFTAAKERIEAKLDQVDPEKDEWLTLRLKSYLGNIHLKLGDAATAETLLLKVFESQSLFEDIEEQERIKALRATSRRLADVFQANGNLEKQEQWRATYDSLDSKQNQ